MKRLIASTLSAAVFMAAVTPVAAQSYRYSEAFAPQQNELTATVNYRVPLGPTRERATVGLTLAGARADAAVETVNGDRFNSDVRLADLRFDGRGVERALVGGYDFAPRGDTFSYDDSKDPKDGKEKGKEKTWLWIGLAAIVVVAVVVANDDDKDNHSGSSS